MPTIEYKNNKGQRIPGTTTILNRFKESGGLLRWAFKQGRAAERGEIKDLYDRRDEAAEAGTLAHLLVEAYIKKESAPEIPQNDIGRQAEQGFQNYIRWESDNRIQIIEQELNLISEKYQYGGTPDAIGKNSRNELVLLDWKTSSSGPFVDFLLQLAAYMILWEENFPDRPIKGGCHLCRFSKETADFHHHYWSELEDAKQFFILLRQAYDLNKLLKKRL